LAGELAREEQIERHTFISEDYIEMDPNERVCEVMDWFHFGQERVGYFYHTGEPSRSKTVGNSMTSCQILTITLTRKRWDSAVSVVTKLWSELHRTGLLAGVRDFSLPQNVQIGSGAHPAPI